MADIDLERLRAVPLFAEISKRDLKHIRSQCKDEMFRPGQDLVREGEPGGRMFIILSGSVKVLVGGRTRRTEGPGAVVGELSVFDKGPRTATVRADTQVDALSISSMSMQAIVQEQPGIALALLKSMAKHLRETNKLLTA